MLQPWPAGSLELFVRLGIIEEMTESGEVWLDDCVDPDWADPTWLFSKVKGRLLGYCDCGWSCGGSHVVERERGRQWRPSFEGLTRCVTAALGLDEGWVEDVPGRVRLLGTLEHQGRRREIFIARGLTWPDGPAVIAQARRLTGATRAAILCPAASPPMEQRQPSWQAVVSLEQAAAINDGRLVLPRSRLFEDEAARPIPGAEHETLAGARPGRPRGLGRQAEGSARDRGDHGRSRLQQGNNPCHPGPPQCRRVRWPSGGHAA